MLKWFRRHEPETYLDDVFGRLELDKDTWIGFVDVPEADAHVQVLIDDAAGEPIPRASDRFSEFCRCYAKLRPDLAEQLRLLLQPWHEEFASGRALERGEDLLQRFELWGLDIGATDLVASFSLREGWDDGIFRVSFEGSRPKGLGVDD